MSSFKRGQYSAFDQVLNWLNTLQSQVVDKKVVYKAVSDMKPSFQKTRYTLVCDGVAWDSVLVSSDNPAAAESAMQDMDDWTEKVLREKPGARLLVRIEPE